MPTMVSRITWASATRLAALQLGKRKHCRLWWRPGAGNHIFGESAGGTSVETLLSVPKLLPVCLKALLPKAARLLFYGRPKFRRASPTAFAPLLHIKPE
jgi:hypothetical protein